MAELISLLLSLLMVASAVDMIVERLVRKPKKERPVPWYQAQTEGEWRRTESGLGWMCPRGVRLRRALQEAGMEERETLERFVEGAAKCYALVFAGFHEGNLAPLRGLLSEEAFESLDSAPSGHCAGTEAGMAAFVLRRMSVDAVSLDAAEVDRGAVRIRCGLHYSAIVDRPEPVKGAGAAAAEGAPGFRRGVTEHDIAFWTFTKPLDAGEDAWTVEST